MLLHWGQDAHFAAEVIANSLEGALLRVSRVTDKPAGRLFFQLNDVREDAVKGFERLLQELLIVGLSLIHI